MNRRQLLTVAALGVVAACTRVTSGRSVERIGYGSHPAQFGELHRPGGVSRGVVVVIHGGFWKAAYDLSLGDPLARSLADAGWTAFNLEYRRVGDGGGWPTTFDDIAAGIDALAQTDVDTTRVVTLGHSAGGHLAVWAAGRHLLTGTSWADPRVAVTAAISQAGVLDLEGAHAARLGAGAAEALVGGLPDARWKLADPLAQVPLDVPVRCVHATDDNLVPISQSTTYVDKATTVGADAALLEVEGDHFTVIDPRSVAWQRTLDLLTELG